MRPEQEDDDGAQSDGHFQNYADYSRTLRAWLVAYGVGGPVLFLTNDKLAKSVAKSGHASEIVTFFLIGVGLQILLALINKWSAWHMYRGAGDLSYQKGWRYCFWHKINSWSWIDFWVDLISVLAFVVATWRVLVVFMAPSSAV
jgi:hypothetical protein